MKVTNTPDKPQPDPEHPQSEPSLQQPLSKAVTLQKFQVSGPLPPPEVLEKYDQVLPGAAERIISMAERDSAHLQRMEERNLEERRSERRLGQIFGFVIALVAFGVAGMALAYGYEIAASVIGGGTVVGLATVFVTGRRSGQRS